MGERERRGRGIEEREKEKKEEREKETTKIIGRTLHTCDKVVTQMPFRFMGRI